MEKKKRQKQNPNMPKQLMEGLTSLTLLGFEKEPFQLPQTVYVLLYEDVFPALH